MPEQESERESGKVTERNSGAGGAHVSDRAMPQLDALYREVVLDHYKRPRGRKKIEHPNLCTSGFNPTCGDQVMLSLEVESDRISGLEVQCQGCSISVASSSMMAELLAGKSKEEAQRLFDTFRCMMHGQNPDPEVDLGDLEALSGVAQFPVRIKCALLAWTTMAEALRKLDAPGLKEGPHTDDV